MDTIEKAVMHGATIAFVVGMTGCAGMSSQDKNTAVSAGAGAVPGRFKGRTGALRATVANMPNQFLGGL